MVSGVRGQFNFVDQAFALHDARAVITLPTTRESGGKVTSNIVWDHPHETIPRHLRDIIVTEYGIADLRGGSDAHCVMAMIAIADSRFQPEPLERAKSAGKFPKHAVVPGRHGTNTPDRVRSWLSPFVKDGSLPVFPFGTDFGEVEQRLLPTLSILKAASGSPTTMASLLWNGVVASSSAPDLRACLERLALDRPRSFRERLSRLAVKGAFAASTDAD